MITIPVMHEAWGAWPWLAPVWILLWIAVIVAVISLLLRRGGGVRCTPRASTERQAGEILAERFARGEIDAAEYRAGLDVLRQ